RETVVLRLRHPRESARLDACHDRAVSFSTTTHRSCEPTDAFEHAHPAPERHPRALVPSDSRQGESLGRPLYGCDAATADASGLILSIRSSVDPRSSRTITRSVIARSTRQPAPAAKPRTSA